MRRVLLLGLALVLASAPVSGAVSADDATRDEATHAVMVARADVCHDGSIDITHTSVTANETHITIRQTVRQAGGPWTCAGFSQGASEAESLEVHLRSGPHHRSPSVEAWRATGASAGGDQQCYRVSLSTWSTTECGVGTAHDDEYTWTVPIYTESYVLEGVTFGDVFGIGIVTADVPQAETVISTSDLNELPGFSA